MTALSEWHRDELSRSGSASVCSLTMTAAERADTVEQKTLLWNKLHGLRRKGEDFATFH